MRPQAASKGPASSLRGIISMFGLGSEKEKEKRASASGASGAAVGAAGPTSSPMRVPPARSSSSGALRIPSAPSSSRDGDSDEVTLSRSLPNRGVDEENLLLPSDAAEVRACV